VLVLLGQLVVFGGCIALGMTTRAEVDCRITLVVLTVDHAPDAPPAQPVAPIASPPG
jgi:hypothetical protein